MRDIRSFTFLLENMSTFHNFWIGIDILILITIVFISAYNLIIIMSQPSNAFDSGFKPGVASAAVSKVEITVAAK